MKAVLVRLLLGSDPKLRRLMQYWCATATLYLLCTALMLSQVRAGLTERAAGMGLLRYGLCGALLFYPLVRASARLKIAPRTLTALQALFAISCVMWLYAISGPLRTGSLLILLVVITFCTFALRPRQTLLLAAVALAGMGATMWCQAHRIGSPAAFTVEALNFAYMGAALLSIALLTGEMNKLRARLKRQKEELMAALETIRTLATIDELTSLANRRHMNEVLASEERREDASERTTCIAVLDLDYFKQINDRFGHAAGDAVLRAFAEAARAELRSSDVLARWGGEEFLLMLPATGPAEANQVLERMAARVGTMTVPQVDLGRRLSFSAGLAERQGSEPFAETIGRADRALYLAKARGRARVITA